MTEKRRNNIPFVVAAVSLAIYALACYSQGGVDWAPNDQWFAFTCIAPTPHEKAEMCMQLWMYDVRKHKLHLADQDLLAISRPAVSPDGKSILYLKQDEAEPDCMRVFLFDRLGRTRRELGKISIGSKDALNTVVRWGPHWSPDGKSFTVMAIDAEDKDKANTLIIDAETCRVKNTIPNLGYVHWTPDGSALVGVGAKQDPDTIWRIRVNIRTKKVTTLVKCGCGEDSVFCQALGMVSPNGTYVTELVKRQDGDQEKTELVVLSLKSGKVQAWLGSDAIPVGWAGDETALYLLARDSDKKTASLVRWDIKSGQRKPVYEIPPLYAAAKKIYGTLSHNGRWLALRICKDENDGDEGDLVVLVDLSRKTARPLATSDLSRLYLLELHLKLVERLAEEDRIGDARMALTEYARAIKTHLPLMVYDGPRQEVVEAGFKVFFNGLDDAATMYKLLGAKGNVELRVKCLVRMGKMNKAVKLAGTIPSAKDEKPQMLCDILEFRQMENTTALAKADEEFLLKYIELADMIGATDRKLKACSELVRRFPTSTKFKEIKAIVEQHEELKQLRGRQK